LGHHDKPEGADTVHTVTAMTETNSDSASASQAEVSAEIAAIESTYQRSEVEDTQPRLDYAPYRSSLLRHPTKDLQHADPEGVELWTPCFGERDVHRLESDLTEWDVV
jgi:protocatechuate 3,4-dioxygenase beta subunit